MLTGLLSLLLLVQAPVQGRPVSEASHPPEQVTSGDEAVLGTINAADASVVEAAKLAGSKASNGDVKALATRLVSEHQKSLTAGTRLATELHIERALPTNAALTHAHETAMHELNLLSGSAFDQRFIQLMVSEHEAVVALLDGPLGASATRPQVSQLLAQQLPLLRDHLAIARKWQAAHAPPRSGAP